MIKAGKLKPAGLKELETAKRDGRWKAAYDSPNAAKLPVDFLKELEKNKKAKALQEDLMVRILLLLMPVTSLVLPTYLYINSANAASNITDAQFNKLMNTVATGWNEGNAKKAADCYTEDAFYTEPPDKQVYTGRKALYEFFGGDRKPEPPMKMILHHLAFNAETQIGFGEYTFQMNNRYHGIVIVKIRDGKISNWREYQYQSDLEWKEFVKQNDF